MDRELYSIEEARELLGRISRNSIYALLRTGVLTSVVIGCRRFISAGAIAALISKSTTSVVPSQDPVRLRSPLQKSPRFLSPTRVEALRRKNNGA